MNKIKPRKLCAAYFFVDWNAGGANAGGTQTGGLITSGMSLVLLPGHFATSRGWCSSEAGGVSLLRCTN